MTEHKFTDEEVIKALELHSNAYEPCVSRCPYGRTMERCGSHMAKDAIDLINRQREEIEVIKETTAYRNLERTAGRLVEYHIDEIVKEFCGATDNQDND